MIRITLCRDARSCVRCVKGYSIRGFNGDGRTTVRPYTGLHVTGSIPVVTRLAVLQRTHGRASLHRATRHGVHTSRYTSNAFPQIVTRHAPPKKYEAVTPHGVTASLAQPSSRAPLLRYLVGFDSDTLRVKEILYRYDLDGLGAVALVREEGTPERPIIW